MPEEIMLKSVKILEGQGKAQVIFIEVKKFLMGLIADNY
jgi:hypothetical protein